MTSSANKYTGRKSGIVASAVKLTAQDWKANQGIQIYAHEDNENVIYLGFSSDVTADGADATSGFPLSAGDSINLPARNISEIYVIADGAGTNKVYWIVL